MICKICSEVNIGPDHEITEKHIRNKMLFDYSLNRKQFAGHRKGVLVTCNVKSSFSSVVDCPDGKIKISAKPNEEIKFVFTIKNDTKKEEISVIFIQLAHNMLSFTINDHGMSFGCNPVLMKPKTTLHKEVSITFKALDIGQYEMPIVFYFRKPATNESIPIIRDMVVFLEKTQTVHEKILSPYAQKEVVADKLYKTTLHDRSDDMFRIPRNFKSIYASGLKVKEDSTKEEKDLCQHVRDIFVKGVTDENYVQFFHNLLWYEETIVRINLKNYNMSGVPLAAQGDGYALIVPGLAEKRPSLMLGDLLFIKPHNNQDVMFEAVISEIQDSVAHIRGLNDDFRFYHRQYPKFDVRFFMSRLPLERMHRAVHAVTRGGPEQRRVFPLPNTNVRQVKHIKNYFNPLVENNMEQRCAVEHIVSGTAGQAPYLVHGPPGTGKTVTIVEAILQLVTANPKHRIMVCTDSNMAADHVATMILKYAHMVKSDKLLMRACSKFRVWETLPESLRKYSNGYSHETFHSVSIHDFMAFNIVVTTLSHAAKYAKELKTKRMDRSITHLFIDEAAQASEPACLIPTCGLLSTRGALVLAGDPLQLGPVVISHNVRRLGLGLSLMERLKKNCELYSDERGDANYLVRLRDNFRSNPDILHIPNELFYKGQLRALASTDPLSNLDILGERLHSSAVVFHGVLSKEQKMGKSPSFYNSMELEIVQMYITFLIKQHNVQPDDIGVVTPYIRQVYQIKNWIDKQAFGSGKIEVGTVEAFQGKEKRVIIISTVRANCELLAHDAKFQLGFLVDDKRFNVAITRAKAKAIIIGNPLCLQRDRKWHAYIERCRELGTYYGYDASKYNNDATRTDVVTKITPLFKQMTVKTTKA